ncbi:related to cullulin 3 [Cephalotrichum gorgonifer]|uniref:Related to cullulin 3 n=1 Tax=Cephalotrichum gorgonifer TaxID=2041049 RepID=A0AAE8MQ96_9PEZI|nr:related to cullulin 3 [Cephalotrichum gorgonifer]
MISGRGGAARGRIRPPRRMIRPSPAQQADTDDFESCWVTLRDAISDIHQKNCSTLHFEHLYRIGYKIVIKKKGPELYSRVQDFEKAWLRDHVVVKLFDFINANLISVLHTKSTSSNERQQMGTAFLRALRDTWIDHNTSMNMVADILMYMDRTYTQLSKSPSIFTTTIGLYRDDILKCRVNDAVVLDTLISVLLDQIEMERNGEIVDRVLLRNCIAMLDGLYETDEEEENEKLYFTRFEPALLLATERFYGLEAQRLLSQGDCPAWIHHTPGRLSEESDRCLMAIHSESHDKVVALVENRLIKDHLDEFLALDTGLRWLVDNGKFDELSALYSLVSRVDSSKASLTRVLQSHVVALGQEIQKVLQATDFSAPPAVDDKDGDKAEGAKAKPSQLTASAQQTAAAVKWVDDVLGLKDKVDEIWSQCFQEDLIIQTALTKSFTEFINSFDRASEYVSLFIDDSLRRGIRDKTEAEIDVVLEKAIALIRYILDKDMFERYYQRHLARRLLNSKSESHDVEKQLIVLMKQEFGNQFAFKFEGMFKDMDTSADITTSYRDHIRESTDDAGRVDVSLSILTTNHWPSEVMGRSSQPGNGGAPAVCIYPEEISRLQASVTAFYLQSRNGRKLTWVSALGSADIRCVFPPVPGKSGALAKERRYEVNVPTYGMIVLMLFNDIGDNSLSFEDVQAKTNIPSQDLARTLAALSVAPKCRLLVKEPPTKNVKPGDVFRFNNSFASKTIKIKAPTITATSKVEGVEERKATETKADQTRAHVMDAAIVRIMKQRKQSTHSQLISEVLSQLAGRFKPEIAMVKRRIEDLIAREYLERVEDEAAPTYRYLA